MNVFKSIYNFMSRISTTKSVRSFILIEKNKEHEHTTSLDQNTEPHRIEKTLVERDVGIMPSKDLTWESQTEKATKFHN